MRLLRQMRTELEQFGELPDAKRTVGASIADYMQARDGDNLRPSTRNNDRRAGRLIERGLGSMRLASLTVADCDRFLEAVAAGELGAPMARPQLRRLRRTLVRILANDQRRGLVTRNVAELSILPDESPDLVARRSPRALTYDELVRLLDAARGPTKALIDLSGRNGLRPAEARGLRWSRVDLDALTVRVDSQINRRNEITGAKTKRSIRTIRIDDRTARTLTAWRDAQAGAERLAGPAWQGNVDDLVATTRVGTPINQRNVHRALARTSARAGITPNVSGYDLRHTAITLQVERRRPLHQIADWAGTSERMIQDVYRHKLEEISDLGPVDSAGW